MSNRSGSIQAIPQEDLAKGAGMSTVHVNPAYGFASHRAVEVHEGKLMVSTWDELVETAGINPSSLHLRQSLTTYSYLRSAHGTQPLLLQQSLAG
jgi:hypothetical protein